MFFRVQIICPSSSLHCACLKLPSEEGTHHHPFKQRRFHFLLERRQHNTRVDRKETGRKETAKVSIQLPPKLFSQNCDLLRSQFSKKTSHASFARGQRFFLIYYFESQSCKFNKKNNLLNFLIFRLLSVLIRRTLTRLGMNGHADKLEGKNGTKN